VEKKAAAAEAKKKDTKAAEPAEEAKE